MRSLSRYRKDQLAKAEKVLQVEKTGGFMRRALNQAHAFFFTPSSRILHSVVPGFIPMEHQKAIPQPKPAEHLMKSADLFRKIEERLERIQECVGLKARGNVVSFPQPL